MPENYQPPPPPSGGWTPPPPPPETGTAPEPAPAYTPPPAPAYVPPSPPPAAAYTPPAAPVYTPPPPEPAAWSPPPPKKSGPNWILPAVALVILAAAAYGGYAYWQSHGAASGTMSAPSASTTESGPVAENGTTTSVFHAPAPEDNQVPAPATPPPSQPFNSFLEQPGTPLPASVDPLASANPPPATPPPAPAPAPIPPPAAPTPAPEPNAITTSTPSAPGLTPPADNAPSGPVTPSGPVPPPTPAPDQGSGPVASITPPATPTPAPEPVPAPAQPDATLAPQPEPPPPPQPPPPPPEPSAAPFEPEAILASSLVNTPYGTVVGGNFGAYRGNIFSFDGTVARVNDREGLIVFHGGGVFPRNWDVQLAPGHYHFSTGHTYHVDFRLDAIKALPFSGFSFRGRVVSRG